MSHMAADSSVLITLSNNECPGESARKLDSDQNLDISMCVYLRVLHR